MIKKILAISLVFPLLSVSLFIGKVNAEAPTEKIVEKTEWTVEEVKTMVDYYADKHGLSRQVLHKVISCESQYNEKAYNGKDKHANSIGSMGAAQFGKYTFLGFAEKMGRPDYDNPYNPNQALDVAAWAIKKGYGSHWSCFNK